MKKPKITAARIMYIAAIQIVVTTVGFILYRRHGCTFLYLVKKIRYSSTIVAQEPRFSGPDSPIKS